MHQEIKPRDMSLPDRVAVLERGLEKERNRRKLLKALVFDMMEHEKMRFTEKGKEMLSELELDD
jgi:hypothetical protein